MDCFFAAVVLRNYPEYRGMPVAISHQGKRKKTNAKETISQDRLLDSGHVPKDSSSECATCNYEARKAGVRKGMYLGEARALCPNLIVLQYDFEGYEEVSEQVSDILHRHADVFNGFVEQVSCDEAYMELFIPDYCDQSDDDIIKSPNEIVAEVAETIRADIFDATQCTATVGAGMNKLLAKLATDRVKPNKSFVVKDHRHLLQSLQLRDLNGIGYRLGRRLAIENLISVKDVWDLGDKDGENELCRILGPGLGKKIFRFCQGEDDRPVQPAARKTIGAECNYGVRFDGPYGVDHMIKGLAKEVEKRMTHIGVKGSQVTVKVKQRKTGAPPPPKFLGHGSCHNLSKSQSTPNSVATRDKDIISDVAMTMFRDLNVPTGDVRGMGIVISKLSADEVEYHEHKQSSIRNWFNSHAARSQSRNDEGILLAQSSATANQKSSSDDEVNLVEYSMQDGSEADEVLVVEMGRSPAESTPQRLNDCDIALPSLSQIHMSQVKALPTHMQRHIEARILAAMETADSNEIHNANADNASGGGARFRQTDVKRMLQLAAVKSGQKELHSFHGDAVSLTQLGNLPLELQLQVANADQQVVGKLTDEKKNGKNVTNRSGSTKLPGKRLHGASKFAENSANNSIIELPGKRLHVVSNFVENLADNREKIIIGEPKTMIVENGEQVGIASFQGMVDQQLDPRDFFHDNVMPLHIFMDENPFPSISKCLNVDDGSSLAHVIKFFSLCLAENRLADVVVLLRSIRNRNDDGWSMVGFEAIFDSVNQLVEEQYGSSLDKDWLV